MEPVLRNSHIPAAVAAVFALSTCPTLAADLPAARPAEPAQYYSPAPDAEVPEEKGSSGWYVRGDAGYSFSPSAKGRLGLGGALVTFHGLGDSVVLGLGGGYRLNKFVRVDITGDYGLGYKVRGDYSTASSKGKLVTVSTLLNAYVDVPVNDWLVPYVGAGVGWGWLTGTGGIKVGEYKSQSDGSWKERNYLDGLTWAAMGGVAVNVTEHIAFDLGYRYRRMDLRNVDLSDHMVRGGVRYSF